MQLLKHTCIAVFVIVCLCKPGLAQGDANVNHSPTREELELINARIQKEKAEAIYYDQQTLKLKKEPPVKTLWQNIKENPASILGVLGAFVALLSFVFNYRTTLQNQRDGQFYEALKRFGDKDSPTIRATAAATLGEMAAKEVYLFGLHPRRLKSRPYLTTVRSQLLTGLMLEECDVVIQVIIDETIKLIGIDPSCPLLAIRDANIQFRNELLKDSATFLALKGVEDLGNKLEHWQTLSSLTRFSVAAVLSLVEVARAGLLDSYFAASLTTWKGLDNSEKAKKSFELQTQLALDGFRLRILIYLCCTALKKHAALKAIPLEMGLFLGDCNLEKVNLSGLQLEGSIFSGGVLDSANLSNANLADAKLKGCSLTETNLWKIQMDGDTDFSEAKWWKASYVSDNKTTIDEAILATLYKRYGEPTVPPNELHASVAQFLKSQKPKGG